MQRWVVHTPWCTVRGIVQGRNWAVPRSAGCSPDHSCLPQDCVCHRASRWGILGRGDGECLQGGQVTGALLLCGKGDRSLLSCPPHPAHTQGLTRSLTNLPSTPQMPLVYSLEPAMGPKAGGTRITIHGSDLHVGSELQVLLNDTEPCTELV